MAFVVSRLSKCKTIPLESLLSLKYLIEQLVLFDIPAIQLKALEAAWYIAEHHVNFVETLCNGNNLVRICISGLQSSIEINNQKICLRTIAVFLQSSSIELIEHIR